MVKDTEGVRAPHERQLWGRRVESSLSALSLTHAIASHSTSRAYKHTHTQTHPPSPSLLFFASVRRNGCTSSIHSEYASPVNASPALLNKDRNAHVN